MFRDSKKRVGLEQRRDMFRELQGWVNARDQAGRAGSDRKRRPVTLAAPEDHSTRPMPLSQRLPEAALIACYRGAHA
jgi:hypothetical protein